MLVTSWKSNPCCCQRTRRCAFLTATPRTGRPEAQLEIQQQRPANVRCPHQVAQRSHCVDLKAGVAPGAHSAEIGRPFLFTRLGLALNAPKCSSSRPGGFSTLALGENSCPLKTSTLLLSGSLPQEPGTQLSASCVLANLWFPFQPVKNLCLCHLLQLPLPHPQTHPTTRPPGEPRPLGPHPHPVLRQLGAQRWKKPTFELLSQTLECLGMLRHQTSQAALASCLLSPQPWPHADPGQFPLIRHLLVSAPPHRIIISSTLPSGSISGLSPLPLPTCSLLLGWGQVGRRQRGGSENWYWLTLQVLTGRCESAKEEKSQGPPKFLRLHAAQPAHYPWQAGGWEGKRLGGEQERGAEGLEGGAGRR